MAEWNIVMIFSGFSGIITNSSSYAPAAVAAFIRLSLSKIKADSMFETFIST